MVGASQSWNCAHCAQVLPAAYQIDHRIPLASGGADALSNLQALCPNCHAAKTQREAVQRRLAAESTEKTAAYNDREDVVVGRDTVQCQQCFQERPMAQDHAVCWALERRFNCAVKVAQDVRVSAALEQFKFRPVFEQLACAAAVP